ncbi:MAG: Uma2 family endonuclease [Verrucomicrobiota bacterium]
MMLRDKARPRVLPLENGDHLHSAEFLRRYEGMPDVKKAELIQGRVYMGSPVRADVHGKPDNLLQTWLGVYAAATPGVEVFTNSTLVLDPDNIFQPDAVLCLSAERGGKTTLNEKGYLCGPAELVVEIAASSASIDLYDKMDTYRRCGVREYLVWRTTEQRFDWFVLENEEYRSMPPDAEGTLHSPTFPGLTLLVKALLEMDGAKVLEVLQNSMKSAAHAEFVKAAQP